MKKILFIIALVGLTVAGGSPAFASNSPNLQLQIFPTECSLDTTALGNVNSLQLTPENCMSGEPEHPTVISPQSPAGENSHYFPENTAAFLQDPMLHIPSSHFPVGDIKGPLIVDSKENIKEKSTNQMQISTITIGVALLITAGLLAAAHTVYTGVLAPLIAQGKLPSIRFPWSKK